MKHKRSARGKGKRKEHRERSSILELGEACHATRTGVANYNRSKTRLLLV